MNEITPSTQITLGGGFVDVGVCTTENEFGVILRPRENHIPVGDDGELADENYTAIEGDVVIWFRTLAGLEVLQRAIEEAKSKISVNAQSEKPCGCIERYARGTGIWHVPNCMCERRAAAEEWCKEMNNPSVIGLSEQEKSE